MPSNLLQNQWHVCSDVQTKLQVCQEKFSAKVWIQTGPIGSIGLCESALHVLDFDNMHICVSYFKLICKKI